MAGFLARLPGWRLPTPSNSGTVAEVTNRLIRLTAAGTAPVLHRIPF